MNIKAKRQQVLKCVKRENLCLTMQTQLQSETTIVVDLTLLYVQYTKLEILFPMIVLG